jgi:hypothetical protein
VERSGFVEPNLEPHLESGPKISAPDWIVIVLLIGFSLLTLTFPTVRSFYRIEISYNEGWNAYNQVGAVHHVRFYPSKYGWTTVNCKRRSKNRPRHAVRAGDAAE